MQAHRNLFLGQCKQAPHTGSGLLPHALLFLVLVIFQELVVLPGDRVRGWHAHWSDVSLVRFRIPSLPCIAYELPILRELIKVPGESIKGGLEGEKVREAVLPKTLSPAVTMS